MGIVYDAEHRVLRTPAVVKVLRADCLTDPSGAADRLRLEAQAGASLRHNPHIVRVQDFGRTADGSPYLVMEKLDGRDLRAELEARGPLPVVEAVKLARQMLAGLAAAHAIGIGHRDIKPANLFLCALENGERTLKILDFGIAKVLDTADSARAPSPLAKPTLEGVTLGTPQYISPEQALAQHVDGRSDIYAVGAVLYWLLTGRAPFRHHRGAFAVMRAHVLEQPAPPSSRADQTIPEALDEAILKALSKRPSDRFQTAEAFSSELQRVLEEAAAHRRWPRTQRLDTRAFQAAVGGPRCDSAGATAETTRRDSTAETLPWPRSTGSGRAADLGSPEQRDSSAATLVLASEATPEAPGSRSRLRGSAAGVCVLLLFASALLALVARLAGGL